MKKPLTKREPVLMALAGIGLVVIVVLAIYAGNLRADNQKNKTIINGQASTARRQDVQSNKTSNYVETICAEYRKLYQAYATLRAQHPANGTSYALPGSAKGEVDQCYQL